MMLWRIAAERLSPTLAQKEQGEPSQETEHAGLRGGDHFGLHIGRRGSAVGTRAFVRFDFDL